MPFPVTARLTLDESVFSDGAAVEGGSSTGDGGRLMMAVGDRTCDSGRTGDGGRRHVT
jgi:hypothetical protein